MSNQKKYIIVQNATHYPIPIPEIKQVLPADGRFCKLEYDIAFKYRNKLKPIEIIVEDHTPDYAGSSSTNTVVNNTINITEVNKAEAKIAKKTVKKKAVKKRATAKRPASRRKPVTKKTEIIDNGEKLLLSENP